MPSSFPPLNKILLIGALFFLGINTSSWCQCIPASNCSFSEYISTVRFATINNVSACSNLGYTDYTGVVAPPNINAGTTTMLSINVVAGMSTSAAAVWIDHDHSGTYDSTEFWSMGTGPNSFGVQILIPTYAMNGLTKMRIRQRGNGLLTGNDACLSYSDGETEDYTINVILPPVVIFFTPPFSEKLYEPDATFTARIKHKDIGINVSDSLRPRIWARSLASPNWKSFAGNLVNGNNIDGNWSFTVIHDSLGVRRNSCDSILYYFVAQDVNVPPNIGYLPDGVGIIHSSVVTQASNPFVTFGYRLIPRLKDTVYVGGGDCRYASLSGEKGLFQDIGVRKLEGDITILIESTLTEKGIYGLEGAALNGHKVTIRPASNTLYLINTSSFVSSINKSVIKLSNCRNVTIDGSYNGTGRYLQFRNLIYSQYTADTICHIRITNSCDSIVIKNLELYHASGLNDGGENSIYIAGGQNKNITIFNNIFNSFSANTMAKRFIASINGDNQATVRGNHFINYAQAGIKLFTACSNWVIDSNHFYRTIVPGNLADYHSAIAVRGSGHSITNNFIGGQAPFCGGGPMTFIDPPSITGIEVLDTSLVNTPVIVNNNRFDNIITTLAYSPSKPPQFVGITSGNNHTIISNNIIGNPQSAAATINAVADYVGGIAMGGNQPGEISNNIITSLQNRDIALSAYGNVHITGISTSNSAGGIAIMNAAFIIRGNHIFNIRNTNNGTSEEGGTIGIKFSGGNNNLVEKNLIHDITCNARVVSGIVYPQGLGRSVIQRNRIYNLVNYDNTAGGCCTNPSDENNGRINGIYVARENGGLDIVNNQITITNGNIVNPVSIRGIYEGNKRNSSSGLIQKVVYNSVYIGGIASSNGGSGAFVSLTQRVREIYNNIFYNERTGGTKGHYAYRLLYYFDAVFASTKGNHNFYVVRDTQSFALPDVTPVMGWSAWKAYSGFDDSSAVEQPLNTSKLFINKQNGNLNVNTEDESCWYINQKGIPYQVFPGDYDSLAVRAIIPPGITDIGSDEIDTDIAMPVRQCPGANNTIIAELAGNIYQWQVNSGAGFVDISDNSTYSGTNQPTLQLIQIPSAWYGYRYRCVVDGINGQEVIIRFVNTWTGVISTAWEEPGNWSCGMIPDQGTDVIIHNGNLVLSSNTTVRSLKLAVGVNLTVNPGVTLTVTH